MRWTQSTLNRRLLDREPAVRVSSNTPSSLPVAAAWPPARQVLAAAREQGARGLLSADMGPNLRLPAAACPHARYARGHCRSVARATASDVSQSPRHGQRRHPQPLARASRVPGRSHLAALRTTFTTCTHQGLSLTCVPGQRREHGPPRPCCSLAAPPSSLTAAGRVDFLPSKEGSRHSPEWFRHDGPEVIGKRFYWSRPKENT